MPTPPKEFLCSDTIAYRATGKRLPLIKASHLQLPVDMDSCALPFDRGSVGFGVEGIDLTLNIDGFAKGGNYTTVGADVVKSHLCADAILEPLQANLIAADPILPNWD